MGKLNLLNREEETKRSQGHIELILSFVIFVGFVVALLFIINPVSQQSISDTSWTDVQQKFLDNLSITYDSVSLILNDSFTGGNCFFVKNRINKNSNFVVRDESDNGIPANINSQEIYLKSNGKRYYKFYFYPGFENNSFNPVGCTSLNPHRYIFGALITEKILFYNNLYLLNSSYMLDYPALKSSLNIDNDFDFVVSDLSGHVLFNDSLLRNGEKATSVISHEIFLKTLNKNAEFKDVSLILRVW